MPLPPRRQEELLRCGFSSVCPKPAPPAKLKQLAETSAATWRATSVKRVAARREGKRQLALEKDTRELTAGKDLRILVAEDSDFQAQICVQLLEAAGFAVDRVACGEQVITHPSCRPPPARPPSLPPGLYPPF